VLLDGRPAVQAKLRDITPREAAEAALRRSEEQRRLALEAAGLGLWDVDYLTGAVSLDGRFRDLYGLGPEEEVGSGVLWRWVHPEDAPRVRAAVARAKDPASGGVYEAEYRVVLRDGSERWHLAKAQVHFEGEGDARRAARFVGVVMDVTERRRAEAALRESEARLRLIADHVPAQIAYLDRDLRYRFVNRAFAAFLRAPSEDILGRTVEERVGARTWARLRPWFGRALAGEAVSFEDEEPDKHGPGRSSWTEENYVPRLAPDGGVEGVHVQNLDVPARKRAEAGLQESEARLRQFGEASSDVLWVRDAATLRFEYVSPAFETIYGVPLAEVMRGDTLRRWARLIHPEDRERALDGMRRMRRGERVEMEYRVVHPDGRVRWVHDTDFPLLDTSGRVQRVGGIGQDVTEAKEAEERQRRMTRELDHRVKNVLALVQALAFQTLEAGGPPEAFADAFAGRLDALARAHGLLTATGWAGADLRDLVEETLAPYLDGNAGTAADGPAVALPPRRAVSLAMVLHELATNAAKYGALSVPGGRVEVRWSVDRGGEGEPRVRLVWREAGGPAVREPEHKGFGTALIEQTIEADLDGSGELRFGRDGLVCELAFTLG
jgi:PAS domain S-box-containing protein